MENFYDFQDKFRRVVICKTNSSSMSYEVINLGTKENPQNVNLGTDCTNDERVAFIRLFKEFKDIFFWTYDDLKTFDPNIMQHTIPIDPNIRPFQQKLRKIHPNLEPSIKKELRQAIALLKNDTVGPSKPSPSKVVEFRVPKSQTEFLIHIPQSFLVTSL